MKSPVVLPLPVSSPSEVVPELTRQVEATPQPPLWLALVFSKLALEVHSLRQNINSAPVAAVAVIKSRGRFVVHTASHRAEALGINPSMPINAAYALCPQLKVVEVDETAQKKRLQELAGWAHQYTSKVSIHMPQALLLEIRGSLKLFGGMEAIQQQIHQQLTEYWQHSYQQAVTPTPKASLLLANAGCQVMVQRKDELRSVLGQLPIVSLPLTTKKKLQLRKTGVQVLRDLWRLPKDALARRFGPELTQYIDYALGVIPEPLAFHQQADHFEMFYEFPMEVRKAERVINVGQQMLEQLVLFLRQRDACINQCLFRLHHGSRHSVEDNALADSIIKLGMRKPGRDYEHLCLLLQEHFGKAKLPAPVSAITLNADQLLLFTAEMPSLFDLPGFESNDFEQALTSGESNIDKLLEQLQVRLGNQAIKTIHTRKDHRPEYAWRFNEAIHRQSEFLKQQTLNRQRPLFILSEPQLLRQQNNQPWINGPVMLLCGPERIEGGWWSGNDIRRDYYIGLDIKKSQLWLFQELRPDYQSGYQWYLHGFFA